MAKAEFLGNVEVVAHGEDASCGTQTVTGDDERSVVQGRVLEEDVLDEALVHVGIDDVARGDDVVERHVALQDDEGSHLVFRHGHTCHDHGHDAATQTVAVGSGGVAVLRGEEAHQSAYALMAAEVVEELTDVVLEDDDDGNHAHGDELVEDGAEEAHLQYLRYEHPHHDEHDDAHEGVERARLAHQPVDIEKQQGYQQYVDEVLKAEINHFFWGS